MSYAYIDDDGDYILASAEKDKDSGAIEDVLIEANHVALLERDRIVALLEDLRTEHLSANEGDQADAITKAIALIEGDD